MSDDATHFKYIELEQGVLDSPDEWLKGEAPALSYVSHGWKSGSEKLKTLLANITRNSELHWLARPEEKARESACDVKVWPHIPASQSAAIETLRTFLARTPSTEGERLDYSIREGGVPVETGNRMLLENERLKSQVIAERRTARLARLKEDELLRQQSELVETIRGMSATENLLTRCLTAQVEAKVCLHEKYTGSVSELLGEQVVVVYEMEDGEAMKQLYNRKQFIAGRIPREGEEVSAYIFIAHHGPQNALLEKATDSSTEPDFSGFEKRIIGDAEI